MPWLTQVVKDDWLVNDDSVGGCEQVSPRMTPPKTGYIIVWVDSRNGHDPDIYGCIVDSNGVPIDSAFLVNDDVGGNNQSLPAVDADSVGNFVVVWEDDRNGDKDIYGRRYDKNGLALDTSFRINDDPGTRMQYEPGVAVHPGGWFMVVWRDDRGTAPDVYAQVYDSSGSPMGSNFIVNDDLLPNAFQCFPWVAVICNHEFGVVWLDTRAGCGIFCQRYTKSGAPVGSNFEVTDNSDSTAPMRYPFIGSNAIGKTVIVWRDHREHDSYPNIYTQQYDSLWDTTGVNFRVNEVTGVWHDEPCVTIDLEGNFVVVWRKGIDNPDIYGQRYDSVGNAQGVNFQINEFSPGTKPGVAVDTGGNFFVIWQDNSKQDSEILGQRYTEDGNPIGNNFEAIPDAGMADQEEPQIAMNMMGNFVIVWEDRRGYNPCVFAQIYDADGNPIAFNFRVNIDTSIVAGSPSVAIDSAGNFVIAWFYEETYHNMHIYGCRFTSSGVPVCPEFEADTGIACNRFHPSVTMDAQGKFVIVWEDYRNDSKRPDIYAQRYDIDCTPIDSNFRVNQYGGERSESPCVAMTSGGEFVVVWQEGIGDMDIFDIYGQRYNASGDTVGVNFRINDDPLPQDNQTHPSIVLHDEGNFIVVWTDTREGNQDIYGQIYGANGVPVGANFKINDDTGSALQDFPSVALHPETKDFIVVWTDYRDDNPQIMAQKYDSLGNAILENFQMNNANVHPCNYHLSTVRSVGAQPERVGLTWTDNRRLKGWDVYAKLVKWEFMRAEEIGRRHGVPLQVYPNPVPPGVRLMVKYTICRGGFETRSYQILLYDKAGRVVAEFGLPKAKPGVCTAEFDVSFLSSGVYFIKLSGPNVDATEI